MDLRYLGGCVHYRLCHLCTHHRVYRASLQQTATSKRRGDYCYAVTAIPATKCSDSSVLATPRLAAAVSAD